MKKVISKILIIISICCSVGVTCGYAAKDRVPDIARRVVVEKVINNSLIDFLDENLRFFKIDEDGIRNSVNDMEIIRNVTDMYVDAALSCMNKAGFGKPDIAPFVSRSGISSEFYSVLKEIVYKVIEHFDINPDFKQKIVINSAISIGCGKIVDSINKQINNQLDKINFRIRLEIKMYFLAGRTANRLAMAVVAVLALIVGVFLKERRLRIYTGAKTILIAGAVSVIILGYNIIKTNYKVKKLLGFTIPLGLGWYMIIPGVMVIAGLICMLVAGKKLKRGNNSENNSDAVQSV